MARQAPPDQLAILIDQILQTSPPFTNRRKIPKVPDQLRSVNNKAYEPQVVAIGPYHTREHLMLMEKFKLNSLRNQNEQTLPSHITAIGNIGESARDYYEMESFPNEFRNFDKFMAMLLIDSCYVVDFIRLWPTVKPNVDKDATVLVSRNILRDMLLLENQLPFPVLRDFFQRIAPQSSSGQFESMVVLLINDILKFGYVARDQREPYDGDHLLSFMYSNWHPSNATQRLDLQTRRLDSLWNFGCATELREIAGVRFVGIDHQAGTRSLFDIRFENGTLQIPIIVIDDVTESLLRNLIAYEVLTPNIEMKYVRDYIRVMHSLIKSTKDVEVLCDMGIINGLGNDHSTIAQFFVGLASCGFGDLDLMLEGKEKFTYPDLAKNVLAHRNKKRYRYKAKAASWVKMLRRDYFSSPWAFISFFAAVILLVLTFLQTLYSVKTYYDHA